MSILNAMVNWIEESALSGRETSTIFFRVMCCPTGKQNGFRSEVTVMIIKNHSKLYKSKASLIRSPIITVLIKLRYGEISLTMKPVYNVIRINWINVTGQENRKCLLTTIISTVPLLWFSSLKCFFIVVRQYLKLVMTSNRSNSLHERTF